MSPPASLSPKASVIVLAEGYGQAQTLRDALGYQTSVGGRAWTSKQDRELISAPLSNRVAGSEAALSRAPATPSRCLPASCPWLSLLTSKRSRLRNRTAGRTRVSPGDAQLLSPWEKRGAIESITLSKYQPVGSGLKPVYQRLRRPWPETNPFG